MQIIHSRMRDVFIEAVATKMAHDDTIIFLTADLGSPQLDVLSKAYPRRVINVGIAEQNLINVATGMALEGFKVVAYAIAPFITLRCCEQIRNNLAILSSLRPMNVTLLGVGAGFSYDLSGPTHQALEDISIMRTLPNIEVISPADSFSARAMVDFVLSTNTIKYIRLDSKPLPDIYNHQHNLTIKDGFSEFASGTRICLLSTGYMTHKSLAALRMIGANAKKAGLIDVFLFKTFNRVKLARILNRYTIILTLEEAFIDKGGLDALILSFINQEKIPMRIFSMGIQDKYFFPPCSRDAILEKSELSERCIADKINSLLDIEQARTSQIGRKRHASPRKSF